MPDDLRHFLNSRAPGNQLGIVVVDRDSLLNGNESELVSTWLTEEERLQLNRYSFEKRRNEWFLGRICAKQSAIDLLGRYGVEPIHPHDIIICVKSSGRPYLVFPLLSGIETVPDISISHSHDKVTAIAGNCRCGIDIQKMTDTLFKVRDRFCSETELAALNSSAEDELVQLGMLWVAKEAIRKCLDEPRPTGFLSIHLKEVRYDRQFRLLDFQIDDPQDGTGAVTSVVHIDNDYSLGVCTIAGDRRDA